MDDKIRNGLKIAAEALITPGSSLIAEGQLGKGALHVGLGLIGSAAFGLPAIALIGASSYFRSLEAQSKADRQQKYRTELAESIKQGLDEGLSLEEIKAGIVEDVEDTFYEVSAGSAAPASATSATQGSDQGADQPGKQATQRRQA